MALMDKLVMEISNFCAARERTLSALAPYSEMANFPPSN